MTALALKLTDAGVAAVQGASGSDPVTISHLAFTATPFTFAPTLTALPGEFKRIGVESGIAAAPNITHLTAYDVSADVWSATGFGLFTSTGTLFAVYTGADVFMSKAAVAFALVALDIAFETNLAASIAYGNAVFTYPPATEDMRGVAEIATQAEVDAGTDTGRIVTPARLATRLVALLTPVTTALNSITDALATFALKATTVTGDGLVTGGGNLSANRTLTVTEASMAEIDSGSTGATVVTPRRLKPAIDAINALRAITVHGSGLITGGGSLAANRTLTVTEASAQEITDGTASDKVVTPRRLGPIAMSLQQNGFIRFFGFQIVWGQFNAAANTTTTAPFAQSFQTACFSAVVSGVSGSGVDSQDNAPAVVASTITKDGFSVFSADDTATTVCFIAVGT